MKLLIDEDSQARKLLELLQQADHDLQTTSMAGLDGSNDRDVLVAAVRTGRALLTRNGLDFKAIHAEGIVHCGILIVNEDRDPSKNMSFDDITRAISNLESSGWDISGQVVSLNDWQFDSIEGR